LPSYSERRVPGLRLEEVAALAGVGIDYHRRLERGRVSGTPTACSRRSRGRCSSITPSAPTCSTSPARCTRRFPCVDAQSRRASARRCNGFLTRWARPALVGNWHFDLLAANRLGRALYAPMFDSPEQPANSARFTFLDPAAVGFYPDWDKVADELVAHLRSVGGQFPHDRGLSDLIGQLATRSPEFRTRWATTTCAFTAPAPNACVTRSSDHGHLRDDATQHRRGAHDGRLHRRARLRLTAGARHPRQLERNLRPSDTASAADQL
jgi:hypothetical protein